MKPWHRGWPFLVLAGLALIGLMAETFAFKAKRDRGEAEALLHRAQCVIQAAGGIGALEEDIECIGFRPDPDSLSSSQWNATLSGVAKDLRRVLELRPSADTLYFLGATCNLLQEQDKAYGAFQQAFTEGSRRPTLLFFLAGYLIDRGRYQEAEAFLASPRVVKVFAERSRLVLLGSTYVKQSRWDKAGESGRRLLEIDPKELSGMVMLWAYHLSRNETSRAADFKVEALSINPKLRDTFQALKPLVTGSRN